MQNRNYTNSDHLLISFDQAVRTLFGSPLATGRPNPAESVAQDEIASPQRSHSAGLMRVNHCGEVCAQALYQGQALTAKLPETRTQMESAATEENDHLLWCKQRLQELDGHTSYLNPAWYLGSFGIGALAGLAGDRWSLGFIAETEHQVVEHLDKHLSEIDVADTKSRAILEQMREDEQQHATAASHHQQVHAV